MYDSHFTPAYALRTAHPYAQYTGDVTYPGPTVMSVGTMKQETKQMLWGLGGLALGAIGTYVAMRFVK